MSTRRALLFAVPLAAAAAAGGGFYIVLHRMQQGTFDPRGVPTVLLNKRVPGFRLPGLIDAGFASTDLFASGRPILVNFWATWCPPCIEEHPVLMAMQAEGIPIWGIAYKDKRSAAVDYLERNGNPYARNAIDAPGRVAIDWGLTGVPETFLVDGDGFVRWHMSGPLTLDMVHQQIRPLMRKYTA
ncbi:MAG: cytochrome C biogenesis protein [Rhodospirillales bacterium 70-18]|nr:DsbE family thiol:disulfide interchange protein [Rhodospirillales bacterium]OJY73176.1 MAG: cytochrome C biogenesis protein [Rhodospirillales bacterium 70-18]